MHIICKLITKVGTSKHRKKAEKSTGKILFRNVLAKRKINESVINIQAEIMSQKWKLYLPNGQVIEQVMYLMVALASKQSTKLQHCKDSLRI